MRVTIKYGNTTHRFSIERPSITILAIALIMLFSGNLYADSLKKSVKGGFRSFTSALIGDLFPREYKGYKASSIPNQIAIFNEFNGTEKKESVSSECKVVRNTAGKRNSSYTSHGRKAEYYWDRCIKWLANIKQENQQAKIHFKKRQKKLQKKQEEYKQFQAKIEAALPEGYTILWNTTLSDAAIQLIQGKLTMGDLKKKSLRADRSMYSLKQIVGNTLYFKHRAYPHNAPIFATEYFFENPLVGMEIGNMAALWEIYGTKQFITVLGASQQAILIKPIFPKK